MIKTIALSTLLLASLSAMAGVQLKLIDSANGVYVKATELSRPVSGLDIKVENVPQLNGVSFSTDKRGRVFIPLSLNASRSVKVEAIDMGEKVVSRNIFLSHSH